AAAAAAAVAAAVEEIDFSNPDRAGGRTLAAPLLGDDSPAANHLETTSVTAESARTEGYKRVLFMRVDFPDYTGEQATIPLSEAETLLRDMRTYGLLMSYGAHGIAPIGPGGSAVTPILRMGSNASTYNNEGLSLLYPEARAKAMAAGFDLSDYDYDGVFTKSRPSVSYAGLAYVGGRGFHMANGYFSKHVTMHEYGHNLGLPHAHRWDTDDESIIGPGTLEEYGNDYDPMGDSYSSIPGEKHYTGGYKNYLDWIPDADAELVTTSGLYRLTASDFPQARGRRALRLRKDNRDYWIEFRGGLTGSLLSNSVFLQWGNSDGRQNYLLDAMPGVSGSTLAVGRTFSDPRANNGVGVHVTPVRKGGTYPESMDVQVTIGSPAGNRAPVAVVAANTAAAPADTPIVFTASATDPENDALAYAWDFGNGAFSTDNLPQQTRIFDEAGEYRVLCTVSDMRGGTHRAGVIVKVEAPSVFRITGRVLDTAQRPVQGIQITAANGSERVLATSDASGFYALTGLEAKAWTLTAREIVADTLNFILPFHSSTLTVGPNREGVDFVASSGPQETVTPLVAKRSVWKWFAEGTDPPGDWRQPGFNDANWEEGAGVLGYGNENGQSTTLPFGPSSSTKWTGSFLRRVFTLTSPAQFPTLRLEAMRDDGLIVYLNGHEVFRDNLPSGPITYATQAIDATEPADYVVRNINVASALPAGLLVAGTNYITASVHQATSTSSDLAFDVALSGVVPLSGAGDAVVYLASPLAEEVMASTAPTILLRASARVRNGTVQKVEFFGNGERLGEVGAAPFEFEWPTPAPGRHEVHVVASWNAGAATSSKVGFVVEPPPATLVPADANWRYRAVASAAPAGWQTASFDDSSWVAGPAPLGFGEGDEATVIPSGTPTNRPITSYFRHRFFVEDPRAVSELTARLIRDDGALVWINGVEVIRSNLPATGTIAYSTLATGAGPNAIDNAEYTFPVDPAVLVAGLNTVAVEVHQSDATSSDLSFQLVLEGRTTAPRPRGLALQAQAEVIVPQLVALTAEGVAGGELGLARVEFLVGETRLGEDISPPFRFEWTGAPVGTHRLTAVATDTAGGTLTSAPALVNVLPPPSGTALVSFGEMWRYLDEGMAPAANWRARTGFDDTGWPQGRARLGYGGDGEATVVGFGQQPSSRHITTWFRKRFTVADPALVHSLQIRLIRDDGAVVSLNGTEVMRSNLPAGTLATTTLALGEVTGAAERQPVVEVVPATLLVAGENVLAVEVHQAIPGSSDLGIDLEVIGFGASGDEFRFTSPAVSQSVAADMDIPLSVWAAPELGVERVEYFAGPALIGASVAGPEFPVLWTTPLIGTYPLTARAALVSGGERTAGPLEITVGAPRAAAQYVAAGSPWKYWDTGGLLAANWAAPDYVDTAWKSGTARLGFGADDEATAIQSGHIAYYFRRTFTVTSLAEVAELTLRFQRDDGAVVYLNGVEVARENMPAGLPLPATLASADASNEDAWIRRVLAPGTLRLGTNVLAAEVHQRTATSSDLGWDAELTSRGVNLLAVANSAPSAVPASVFSALRGPTGVADGWELAFAESTGRLYVIEKSEDLIDWSPHSYEFARAGQITVRLP
ncbi:MAG: Ig-like domain-containing protein, partial [Verrucomicrobiales bacterium]